MKLEPLDQGCDSAFQAAQVLRPRLAMVAVLDQGDLHIVAA
jgi:hypothetical protein